VVGGQGQQDLLCQPKRTTNNRNLANTVVTQHHTLRFLASFLAAFPPSFAAFLPSVAI